MNRFIPVLSLFLCVLVSPVFAAENLAYFQHGWVKANYELTGKPQEEKFEQLIEKMDEALAESPKSVELLIWSGILRSSFAGAKGGLGALSLAKHARDDLEAAIAIDGNALQGAAYTSIGILHAKVPGWPVAFGSDKKAKKYLSEALAINPDGIDSNYFYGVFLQMQGELAEAEKYFLKAQQAPPRMGREDADAARHKEIASALRDLRKEMKKS